MFEGRSPPAYQEYAASMIAKMNYRLMSLSERGLLYTLRQECWVNQFLPANNEDLQKYLGINEQEFNYAYTDRLRSFFKIDKVVLTCPELENYRELLNGRRLKQSEGGKKGSAKVNARNKNSFDKNENEQSSSLQVSRRVTRESLVKNRIEQNSKTQSLENDTKTSNKNDEWVNDYDRTSNGD
jgi:hypothetical protein